MKNEIISHIHSPAQLEKLYRANKVSFKREFNLLYPELKGNNLADFWYERLNYINESRPVKSKDLSFLLIASLLAGFIAKIPNIFNISEDFFYSRNIGFIIFPALIAFFVWKNKLSINKIVFIAGSTLLGVVFINFRPDVEPSDTLILSCIHLLLFLWCLLGFAFVGKLNNNSEKRLSYLRYNGDLVVITTVILIAGGIMSALTIGLFSLIGIEIEQFYFDYFGIFGLVAAPIVGTYLTQTNPQLVGKVSPVIARIFSPLVLIMLVFYLSAIIYSGKDPYNDREFLLIFNALLIGVMAIIFFSVAETFKSAKSHFEIWILFLLSVTTIIVNGIAISAIVFRISEWGITPNRLAVLGSNFLILVHLLLVSAKIVGVIKRKIEISKVGKVIVFYLPVYFIWTVIVTFLFPIIFGFK